MKEGNDIYKGCPKLKLWYVGNFLFSILFLIIVIYCSRSNSLWVDEVFSLKLVRHNWAEMLKLATMDVHPPLYYFILKLFISIFQPLGLNVIFIGKVTSFIPYFLMLTWITAKIVKKTGIMAASLFGLLLVGMPNLLIYGVEIRGYSWAMFFVTASFFYAEELVTERGGTKHGYLSLFLVCWQRVPITSHV